MERYIRANFFATGLRLMKERICRAAVSQRLTNTAVQYFELLDKIEVNHSKE